jgi:tRNA A37 threonylcarbamoyladenosine modification protein TsaB
MDMLIVVKNREIIISLKEDSRVLDEIIFCDEHNLTEKLLPKIDELLRKNKLQIADIKKASVFSDSPDSYTTPRIAKTVVNSINWAVR